MAEYTSAFRLLPVKVSRSEKVKVDQDIYFSLLRNMDPTSSKFGNMDSPGEQVRPRAPRSRLFAGKFRTDFAAVATPSAGGDLGGGHGTAWNSELHMSIDFCKEQESDPFANCLLGPFEQSGMKSGPFCTCRHQCCVWTL